MVFLSGEMKSGIETVLDLINFDERLEGVDLVVTGEGRSDSQTLQGKVPYGVLRHAGSVPVVLLSGRIADRDALAAAGFARLVQASPDDLPTAAAIQAKTAAENLRRSILSIIP